MIFLAILFGICLSLDFSHSDVLSGTVPQKYIFNGEDVDPIADHFEWAVWMSVNGGGFCSGSLISNEPTVIMTAAHCVADLSFNEEESAWYYGDRAAVIRYDIGRGEIDGNGDEKGDSIVRLTLDENAEIVFEEDWEDARDIALVYFDTSSLDSSDLSALMGIPVPSLALSNKDTEGCADGDDLTVVGYGLIGPVLFRASNLERTVLQCDINPQCINRMNANDIPNGELCYVGQFTATCAGDSGSPVLSGNSPSGADRTIVGVNAYGGRSAGQCLPGPIKYSGGPNVAWWRDWIDNHISAFGTKKRKETKNMQYDLSLFGFDEDAESVNKWVMVAMFVFAMALVGLYTMVSSACSWICTWSDYENTKYHTINDGPQETYTI